MKDINVGAEIMFAALFLIIGFSYSTYIAFRNGLVNVPGLEFAIFVIITIIGILGFLDGTIFDEKFFYTVLAYLVILSTRISHKILRTKRKKGKR